LSRELGDRLGVAMALGNLGEAARYQEDHASAYVYQREALDIFREIGHQVNVALTLANLGHGAAARGDHATAEPHYREALQVATAIGATSIVLDSLAGLAGVLAQTGRPARALELLGLVAHHPALLTRDTQPVIESALAHLRAQLTPETVEAGLARGRDRALEDVVTEVLAEPIAVLDTM
jgi:tetratricopeptide (TPR) repeat protein